MINSSPEGRIDAAYGCGNVPLRRASFKIKKENPTMRIDLPQNVNFIIDTLYEHGFEAYAVGGCVRDRKSVV